MAGLGGIGASQSSRPYQLVVWGATGFVGQLVCEHIAQDYAGQFKWALAGRNREKLEASRKRLEEINPDCKDIPIIVVDPSDAKSIDKMVKQAQCIVATAGPFRRVGDAIVSSSIRNCTHYCDIAAETLWVRQNSLKYHKLAEDRKVKIVHCCGFDSVPSDLGVLMMVEFMKEKLGKSCAKIDMLVQKVKGSVSGGSIETMLEELSEPYADDGPSVLSDPYCLDPPDSRRGQDPPDFWGFQYNHRARAWTYGWMWQTTNQRIVRRSNALLGHSYGDNFRYSENQEAEGPIDAAIGSLGVALVHWAMLFAPARAIARLLLPKPGDGPPKELQNKGYWNIKFMGFTQEEPGVKPTKVVGWVKGRRDPGYWETSRMVLESGLCLALQSDELREAGLKLGGVLTPATAMGRVLTDRLRKAGMTFEISEPVIAEPAPAAPVLSGATAAGSVLDV